MFFLDPSNKHASCCLEVLAPKALDFENHDEDDNVAKVSLLHFFLWEYPSVTTIIFPYHEDVNKNRLKLTRLKSMDVNMVGSNNHENIRKWTLNCLNINLIIQGPLFHGPFSDFSSPSFCLPKEDLQPWWATGDESGDLLYLVMFNVNGRVLVCEGSFVFFVGLFLK